MTIINPRPAPLLPPDWHEAELDGLGAFPRGLNFVLGKWNAGGSDARGMHALGVLARHPALAKAFLTFNGYIASATTLATRTRELAILRIAWLRCCEYEFVQHVVQSKAAGVSDAEIRRVQLGPDAPGWEDCDGEIVRATDEIYFQGRIADPTWNRLAATFEPRQLLDLVFVVGCYDVLATAILTFDLHLEPGVTPFDQSVRERMLAQRALHGRMPANTASKGND